MADEEQSVETVKYYTRARKFPQLLGRMPDGTKIPGGPYTVQQLLAGVAILVIGGMTIDTWGGFGTFGNFAILFGLAFGAVWGIGRLPMNGRNPFFALVGLYRAMNAPVTGKYQGRPMRLRRPRRVRHLTNVYLGPLPGVPEVVLEPGLRPIETLPDSLRRRLERTDADADSEAEAAPAVPNGPLSGVQALLALVPARDEAAGNGRDSVVK